MSGLVATLAAVVAYAAVRELAPARAVIADAGPSASRGQTAAGPAGAPVALTGAEGSYAAALWPIHSEVKLAAVRMTFAGLAFKTSEPDPGKLVAAVEPLGRGFRDAAERVRGLGAPPSLQEVQERYLQALDRYAAASEGMVRGARGVDDAALLEAQGLSLQASEDLLRVGEVLWPGEHKPH